VEIFLLRLYIDYESPMDIGAFSTMEKAQSYLEKTVYKKYRKDYAIQTLVVDELEKSDKIV